MILREYISHEKTECGYIIHGDVADVLLVFMTSDIIRIRVSFSREFPERSYSLVHTSWPDDNDELFKGERERIKALDVECVDAESSLTFTTSTLKLIMKLGFKISK